MSQNSTPPIVYQRRKHRKNNIALKIDTNDASESSFSGALTAVPPEISERDSEPYISKVRIGSGFQANVPDWCGPVTEEECDLNGEPLKAMDSNSNIVKPQKQLHCYIGNWLQCRGNIEGNGHQERLCGKWRRAPLYEVQNDKWECFSCILWDPMHADCAVPQELPTNEVMKQLKYVEMLRPRLPAKRRQLDSSKSNASQG